MKQFDYDNINEGLLKFLDESPNAFFAVANMKKILAEHGFCELHEEESFAGIKPGGKYYVSRNDSALIAFRLPEGMYMSADTSEQAYVRADRCIGDAAQDVLTGQETDGNLNDSGRNNSVSSRMVAAGINITQDKNDKKANIGFQIMATHADSPVLKIKTNAEMEADGAYVKLNTEKYGGMLCAPWFDRPLSAAGRIIVDTGDGIESRLVNIDRDLMIIPNLAIHMDRNANESHSYNAQADMLPLCAELGACAEAAAGKNAFMQLIAQTAGVSLEDILDHDLFLYNRMKGTKFGINNEFIASGRLDDLQCAYASLMGLIAAEPSDSIAVHCMYDNEEVGSGTKQGAASTFLKDILRRIYEAMGMESSEDFARAIRNSFMVSADNAHSVHPNHMDKADPTNRPHMNAGIVIKYSANQKYTTDAVSGAIFRKICRAADVPYQTFANRSDMPGGSTLGNISSSQIAVNSVDIGLPQLAMHSPYETAGAKDTAYLIEAAKVLYSSSIHCRGNGFELKLNNT